MRRLLQTTACGVLFLLAAALDTSATQTYCAVVRPTPDGFVALRAGPGADYRMVERLRPFAGRAPGPLAEHVRHDQRP